MTATNVATRGRSRGFTLIEVMVVMAILASLVAATSLMVGIAMKKKAISTTQSTIMALRAALEQNHSADLLGRYPPTRVSKLVFAGFDGAKFGGEPNDTNVGIETLYVVFHLNGLRSPQNVDDAIDNTDDDKATTTAGNMQKPDLFEYVDAWGNPIVYINSADYKDPSKVQKYKLKNGTEVKVEPRKNAQTGEFRNADSYQLFSLGPDGVPGTDDDVE